jgi:integrase
VPTIKFTAAAVERLKAEPGARVDYFDAALPGLSLRVTGPKGTRSGVAKTWSVLYRVAGQPKLRRLTIGSTELYSLAEAREKALEAIKAAGGGRDPAAEKREERAKRPDTVEAVVEDFVEKYLKKKDRADGYVRGTQSTFENHVIPRWKGRDIKSITRRDVADLLDEIAAKPMQKKKGARKKGVAVGGPIAANRTLAAIRKMFNWALQRGIVETTPIVRMELPGAEQRRERILSADEIRELWPLLTKMGYPFGTFLQMALVTGQRRNEVAGMQWAHVDLEEKLWTIPSEGTKAGRAQAVPLSDIAIRLLENVPRIGAYVFTTLGDRSISGYSKNKARLDKLIREERAKASVKHSEEAVAFPPWTIHDLRRTVATNLGKLGVSRFVIERILNHADRSVTGIYDRHEYLDEKRAALENWGRRLNLLLTTSDNGNDQ